MGRVALGIAMVVMLNSLALAQSRVGADFNADGFRDLAIGVPGEAVGGIARAGAVNVLYGSATGLQASGTGGPDDQLWHQDSAGVKGAAEDGDGFGGSLATGDFNGDGYDDLAIGVTSEDVEDIEEAGAVSVLYGSAAGLQATGVGGPDDQLWHQDSAGVKGGAERDDHFGVVTAGDFNGDGFDDLAIGVSGEDIGDIQGAGAVNVLYGSVQGLQATGTGGPESRIWHQSSPSVKGRAQRGDRFGANVIAGDFNDDGFEDLAIAATVESVGDVPEAGMVNVLYGSAEGLQATGVGGPDDQIWHQDSDGVEGDAAFEDLFGAALSVGDFNADGFVDLAIGVPTWQVFPTFGAGEVNVLYGSVDGLQATGTGGPDDQLWTQDSPGVKDVADEGDALGSALTTGDFNNDGFDDLAIGVPREGIGAAFDAGVVHVLYGSPTGLQALGVDGPDDQRWHQDVAGVKGVAQEPDQFGATLTAGDFNNDGFDDLVVGVSGEQVGASQRAGAVNVLYGSAAGVQATGVGGPEDQVWHQESPEVKGLAETDDSFGQLP